MTTNQDSPNTASECPTCRAVINVFCSDAYHVMNPQSGGVSAPSTGQLYNAPASAAPDEVREKVARALHKNRCPKSNWDKALPGTHDLFFREADAALSAIPADPVVGMEVMLPPAADVPEEYMNGWIEGQQYLIAAYRGK